MSLRSLARLKHASHAAVIGSFCGLLAGLAWRHNLFVEMPKLAIPSAITLAGMLFGRFFAHNDMRHRFPGPRSGKLAAYVTGSAAGTAATFPFAYASTNFSLVMCTGVIIVLAAIDLAFLRFYVNTVSRPSLRIRTRFGF